MNETSLIKALLINAACQNATAVCANTAGTEPAIDPLIQDTNLQGKGVMVYEEAKIQYAALLRAFQDKTGVWPDPSVPATPINVSGQALGTGLAPLLSAVLPVLSTIPALAPFVPALQAVLGTKPAGPPLTPGADLPPAKPAAVAASPPK